MNKSLVTGASGFIGSHLVRRLAEQGHEVHAVSRDPLPTDLLRVVHHSVDITASEKVREVFQTVQPEHVYHLAASNIASGVISSAEDVVAVNILGTHNLLEAATEIGAKSFITTGSFLEYGPKPDALREGDMCAPIEIYSVSKLAGTLLTQAAARKDLSTVVFRIFTPYGPGMQKGRLVHEIVTRALRNEPIQLSGRSIARDFIYVDDLIRLLLEGSTHASEHAGKIFNAGSGIKTTIEQLVGSVLEKTGSTSKVEWDSFRRSSYDADSWQADMTRTFDSFDWRPQVSLEDGIDAMITSFRGRQ